MKLLFPLLLLSLAANGYFALRERGIISEKSPARSAALDTLSSAYPGIASPTTDFSPLWKKLVAGDTDALAALRAAGWPESTRQFLVTTLVDEHFRAQSAGDTLNISADPWGEHPTSRFFPGLRRKHQLTQNQEKAALLQKLLGPDYHPPETTEPRLQGISREKIGAVSAINADYASIINDLYARNESGESISQEQLALLRREERTDIARLLSPDEFFEYELRNSVTASELRYNTAAFEPTEAEFRALFRIKNPLDEPAFTLDSNAARKLRKDTEAALDLEARPLLGEERFKQFVRSRDAEYRRFYHLARHLQLPTATANTAYAIKADIDQRSRTLDADPDATPAARLALSQEAESRLSAAFGPKGIEIYRLNSQYIERLRQPPSARLGGR